MPALIRYFRAKHEGQVIREEGPSWHEKSGTPTMGGLMFVLAIIVATLISGLVFGQLGPETL